MWIKSPDFPPSSSYLSSFPFFPEQQQHNTTKRIEKAKTPPAAPAIINVNEVESLDTQT